MHKNTNVFKKALAMLLCLSFLIASAAPESVQAATSESISAYLNRCYYSIQNLSTLNPRPNVIATAFLVGEDDIASPSWIFDPVTHTVVAHELYAVDPATPIQGNIYDARYYPQDNKEYLQDVLEHYSAFYYTNRIYNMPQGAQYIEREGAMLWVVACDEEWVTIWDQGYQSWNVYEATHGVATGYDCQNATVDGYLETHPAGFYKIQRNKVWIDFSLSSNHPYQSEAEIPTAGTGVVTRLVSLRPVPNEAEKTYTPVYALPVGTEVNVVSAQLVPSQAAGSTNMYYAVSFNGSNKVQNNEVHYMSYKVPGLYYVDSRYLNFTQSDTNIPESTVLGEIINVQENEAVYAYQSKDIGSQQIGILSLGAEIQMTPSESDAEWTTVYFSGQKAYVQTKYIKQALYKVTDISELCIADIVNDEIKMSWDAGQNNAEYSCCILSQKGKVIWSDKHCKDNSFVIKNKYINKYTGLKVTVQATDKNGNKGEKLSEQIYMPNKGRKFSKYEKLCMVIGRNKIAGKYPGISFGESLQYSTNKKFKNAVTVEKYNKKTEYYDRIKEIKKLKPNTTYYIRRRSKQGYSTAAGTKYLSGKWSKYIKIKTKA